jgi:branched-chain amino acid transport system permease protein
MSELLPFLISGLGVGSVYALSGVGLVVLYRASGVLNFAFGALGAIGAYVAWSVLDAGLPLWLAWVASIATSMGLSLLYGWLIAPMLAVRDSTIRSIGTLGLALVLMGFTEWFWGSNPRRLVLPTDAMGIDVGEVRFTGTRIISLVVAIAMMSAVALLLSRTRIGLKMRALANDRSLSALLGVYVLRVDTVAWLLSGAFAGVCGLLLANIVRLQATLLTFLVIPAFAAAILGRLNSLPATVVAGIVIGVIEATAILIPGFAPFRTSVPFLLALLAIILFPNTQRLA